MKKKFFLIFSILAMTQVCFAESGLYLSEGILPYYFKEDNGTGPITERTYFSSETALGYIVSDWFYLGGIFNFTMIKEKTGSGNSETTHDETYQYYGPSVGYMGQRWFVLAHYFANAEFRDLVTPSQGSSYTQGRTGNGWGFNVGYKFDLPGGGSASIAPVIAYKNISFVNCKDTSSGATRTCSPTVTLTEFTPYLTFLFNFK